MQLSTRSAINKAPETRGGINEKTFRDRGSGLIMKKIL